MKHGKPVTMDYLEKAFGSDSPNVKSFRFAGHSSPLIMGADEAYLENRRFENLSSQLTSLIGLMEILETERELSGSAGEPLETSISSNKVFLVNGRDEEALHSVARFLEHLDLDVTILRELPNEGRTIMEKFLDYSDVGFAVVLLTPDDRGEPSDSSFEEQSTRARQNVIFELGYFIGKLGRGNVTALHRGVEEIPSDYSGVLFTHFDDQGAWKLQLAREMKVAGIDIELNKVV